MTKFSNKYITTFYGALLGPFCPNFGKNEFSWKKKLCQLLNIPTIYNRAKNQKKLMSHSWEKFRPHGRTDRWTDRQRWINTTLRRTKKESYCISKVLGINWSCNSQLVNWNWMVTSFFLFTNTKCTPTMWPNRWYQQAWLSVKEQTVKDLFASDHETPLPQDNIETPKWGTLVINEIGNHTDEIYHLQKYVQSLTTEIDVMNLKNSFIYLKSRSRKLPVVLARLTIVLLKPQICSVSILNFYCKKRA